MMNRTTTVQQEFISGVLKATKNDAEACRMLGFSSAQLSHYKVGRRCADDEAIISMARFLGKDPEEAVRKHRAEQAKTPQMRQFWLSFGKAAASIMIAVALSTPAAKNAHAEGLTNRIFSIMSKISQRTVA